jgi:caffeoyl-CoA O-methyltransferase
MITPNEILMDYIISHSSDEDTLLAELNRETYLKVLNPRMLSGHLQGKLLEFFSWMIKPDFVLEIGTYTGYSAICLAKGLSENGKLITIEKNDEIISYPRHFIEKAGLQDKIEIITGDAVMVLPKLNYNFDLVFIDADKKDYIVYFDLIIDKVKKGGFIIVDNVLWSGKVLGEIQTADKDTLGIQAFNNQMTSDPRVEVIILPIRDGLSLIRKL